MKRVPRWLNVLLTSTVSLVVLWRILALMDTEEDVFRDPRQRARIRLSFAQQYIDSLARQQGVPKNLEDVLAGLSKDRRSYFEFDPWNRRVRFTAAASGYELRSAGPDGVFDSSDDIAVSGSPK